MHERITQKIDALTTQAILQILRTAPLLEPEEQRQLINLLTRVQARLSDDPA